MRTGKISFCAQAVASHFRERIRQHKPTHPFVQFCNLDRANGVSQSLDQIGPTNLRERHRKLYLQLGRGMRIGIARHSHLCDLRKIIQ